VLCAEHRTTQQNQPGQATLRPLLVSPDAIRVTVRFRPSDKQVDQNASGLHASAGIEESSDTEDAAFQVSFELLIERRFDDQVTVSILW
jgi:hypothetical protein